MRQCAVCRGKEDGLGRLKEGERDCGCHPGTEILTHWPRHGANGKQWLPPPPGPRAASVSTHLNTWTNTQAGQEKQPTHLPLALPLSSSLPNTASPPAPSCQIVSPVLQ